MFSVGDRVQVISAPLTGATGIIVEIDDHDIWPFEVYLDDPYAWVNKVGGGSAPFGLDELKAI